jgi:hypothetical protein
MALLFMDSFGGYATADIPTRWAGGTGGGCTIVNTPLPPNSQSGAQVLSNAGGTYVLNNNFGAKARMIVGTRFYRFHSGGSSGVVLSCSTVPSLGQLDGVVLVQVSNSGTFITDSSGNILGSGPVVPYQEWHHYELDATFGLAGTATLKLYMDGNPTPFISVVGTTAYATASSFVLGGGAYTVHSNQPPDQGYYADFYAFDGTGAAPFNAALAPQGLGAAKMAFAVPTAPGIISNWTANGAATIWQCIDQIPQDGDTTYASDATPGDQYQVTFGALPAMQTLIGVQLSTYARTDDAGPRAYQSGFYKGGTYGYSGVNQFLGGTYNYIEDEFMTNPVTGLAWAVGDLTGLQFGAKLTV